MIHLYDLIGAASGVTVAGDSSGSGGSSSGSGNNTPSSRDDAQVQAEKDAISSVRTFLRSQKDARVRTVRFEDSSDGLILVVVYTTRFDADSEEFADLERQIAYGLSSLLPDMAAKPIALGLLSSSNDKPQHRFLIANESATQWMDGKLTDEEFEKSWLVEDAAQ